MPHAPGHDALIRAPECSWRTDATLPFTTYGVDVIHMWCEVEAFNVTGAGQLTGGFQLWQAHVSFVIKPGTAAEGGGGSPTDAAAGGGGEGAFPVDTPSVLPIHPWITVAIQGQMANVLQGGVSTGNARGRRAGPAEGVGQHRCTTTPCQHPHHVYPATQYIQTVQTDCSHTFWSVVRSVSMSVHKHCTD